MNVWMYLLNQPSFHNAFEFATQKRQQKLNILLIINYKVLLNNAALSTKQKPAIKFSLYRPNNKKNKRLFYTNIYIIHMYVWRFIYKNIFIIYVEHMYYINLMLINNCEMIMK